MQATAGSARVEKPAPSGRGAGKGKLKLPHLIVYPELHKKVLKAAEWRGEHVRDFMNDPAILEVIGVLYEAERTKEQERLAAEERGG